MASAPGIDFVPLKEQLLFAQEFQKDVEFLELLILMVSKSCATGSVDITWVNGHEDSRQVIGTSQAALSPCSRYLRWERRDPSQRFCNIVSDHGRRASESCAVCENAAEKRVGQSGHAQVYRCHAGLTDIAVPVIAGGNHIATLYSGQVLTEKPSRRGFTNIVGDVRALTYIDVGELEEAYENVPVVSESEIADTVRILEILAAFLARFWMRLGDTVRAERRKIRDIQMAAKEFAYLILQPDSQDRGRLGQLMKELGFIEPPNRMLVLEFPDEEEPQSAATPFDLLFTAAIQAVEEVAERTKNVASVYLRRRGVCIFFRELTDGPSAGLRGRSLAEKLLYEISSRCSIRVRVGIGGWKPDWRQMAESYNEARLALASSEDTIAVCTKSSPMLSELALHIDLMCQLIGDQKIQEARLALRTLPIMVNRVLKNASLTDYRNFFSSALESLCLTALKAGCDPQVIASVRSSKQTQFVTSASVFDLENAFLETAESVAAEVRQLLFGKHQKVVGRVQQILEHRLKEGRALEMPSLTEAADAVGVSSGHLSRTFRGITGMTFRDYVISLRVEYARKLLLDPLNNVTLVAARCGFSSASYFARMFRRAVGCTPMAYASDPRNYDSGSRDTKPESKPAWQAVRKTAIGKEIRAI